jgi:hypothetical protein
MFEDWQGRVQKLLKRETGLRDALTGVDFRPIGSLDVPSLIAQDNPLHQLVHTVAAKLPNERLVDARLVESVSGLVVAGLPTRERQELPLLAMDGLTAAHTDYDQQFAGLAEFAASLDSRYPDFAGLVREMGQGPLATFPGFPDHVFTVVERQWDGRYFVRVGEGTTSDKYGAYHIAALYRHCQSSDKNCLLTCRIEPWGLNVPAAWYLVSSYYPLVLHRDSMTLVSIVLHEFGIPFLSSEFSRGPIMSKPGEPEYSKNRSVLYLGKQHPKADAVYTTLLAACTPETCFHYFAYLNKLLREP